ncbi:hypothetical protein JCM10207_008508 [Rhodosporidiobolus poonsookiae]
MLRTAARPTTRATPCTHCSKRTASFRTAPRLPHSLPSSTSSLRSTGATATATVSRPSTLGRRTQATYAQATDRVEEHQPASAHDSSVQAADEQALSEENGEATVVTGEGEAGPAAADELVDGPEETAQVDSSSPAAPTEAAERHQALDDLLKSMAVQGEESTVPPSADPSSSASVEPSQPAEPSSSSPEEADDSPELAFASVPSPPARGANLDPSGPQLCDLFALKPKRFRLPSADSPSSHRLVYLKAWESASARLARAFSKPQLLTLAGEDGLALDVKDPALRTSTPRRKGKWSSKRLEQMSKNELIQSILVLEFGMVHPETIPDPNAGPKTSEVIPLSNRTLFLLLSPKSPTIPALARLGCTTQFRRDAKSGGINLQLKGTKASVQAAKEQIEMVEELRTVEHQTFDLPLPASTLRPEVYQSISRVCKVFLEPSPSPTSHQLQGSAITPPALKRAHRLLHSAFALAAQRRATPLAATLPAHLADADVARYTFAPVAPLLPPAEHTTGAPPAFARLKNLSLHVPRAALPADAEDGVDIAGDSEKYPDRSPAPGGLPTAHEAHAGLHSWAERMGLARTRRVADAVSVAGAGPDAAKGEADVLALLSAPFEAEEKQGVKLLVKARYGQVVWPLFHAAGEGEGGAGLGPVFPGQFGWDRFVQWVGRMRGKAESVFVPSPPPGHAASLGVLSRLPPSVTSLGGFFPSFAPAPSPSSFSSDPDTPSAARLADLLSFPSLQSTELRRWVYRPISSSEGQARAVATRVEVEVEMQPEEDGRGRRRAREGTLRGRKVRESLVDLMAPTAGTDAQLSMSHVEQIGEEDLPAEFSELVDSSRHAPTTLEHAGTTYMLTSDLSLRRTLITSPASPSSTSSTNSDATPAPSAQPHAQVQVQEHWHATYPEAARGVDVWHVFSAGAGAEGEAGEAAQTVDELRRSGAWERGIEEVERRCAGEKKGEQ